VDRVVDDPRLSFGPAPGWAWAFAGIAVAAAVASVLADLQGRVLAIAVAVTFAALAVADRRGSPRLVVGPGGLTVRSVTGVHDLAWDDVETVTVDERIRFGRVVHALEVDAGDVLVVLGRRTLAADPVTAARRIVAAAPADRRADLGGDIRRRSR
jgi:hypothetical protein